MTCAVILTPRHLKVHDLSTTLILILYLMTCGQLIIDELPSI